MRQAHIQDLGSLSGGLGTLSPAAEAFSVNYKLILDLLEHAVTSI